jgi:predicted DNA-binding transcriptional regulator AlpA
MVKMAEARRAIRVEERLLIKPEEGAAMLGIGRTSFYAKLDVEIPRIRIGRSVLVDPDDVRAYRDRLSSRGRPSAEAGDAPGEPGTSRPRSSTAARSSSRVRPRR